jgi:hypothetical protein
MGDVAAAWHRSSSAAARAETEKTCSIALIS